MQRKQQVGECWVCVIFLVQWVFSPNFWATFFLFREWFVAFGGLVAHGISAHDFLTD
jgi:hypothetical protein